MEIGFWSKLRNQRTEFVSTYVEFVKIVEGQKYILYKLIQLPSNSWKLTANVESDHSTSVFSRLCLDLGQCDDQSWLLIFWWKCHLSKRRKLTHWSKCQDIGTLFGWLDPVVPPDRVLNNLEKVAFCSNFFRKIILHSSTVM